MICRGCILCQVKEDDEEDEHAHVSFADEVSESDDDPDSSTAATPKLRPSRARARGSWHLKAFKENSHI